LCIGTAFANSDNENQEWTFKTSGRVYSSPLIDGEMVYFGSGDGHHYALNAFSGALLWKFDTGDIVHASPVVYKVNFPDTA